MLSDAELLFGKLPTTPKIHSVKQEVPVIEQGNAEYIIHWPAVIGAGALVLAIGGVGYWGVTKIASRDSPSVVAPVAVKPSPVVPPATPADAASEERRSFLGKNDNGVVIPTTGDNPAIAGAEGSKPPLPIIEAKPMPVKAPGEVAPAATPKPKVEEPVLEKKEEAAKPVVPKPVVAKPDVQKVVAAAPVAAVKHPAPTPPAKPASSPKAAPAAEVVFDDGSVMDKRAPQDAAACAKIFKRGVVSSAEAGVRMMTAKGAVLGTCIVRPGEGIGNGEVVTAIDPESKTVRTNRRLLTIVD